VVLLLGYVCYGSAFDIDERTAEVPTESWLNRSGSITVWYVDEALTPYIARAAVEFGEKENVTVIPAVKPAENFLQTCYDASMTDDNYPDVLITGSETLEKAYLSGMAAEITDPDMQCGPLNFSDAAVNAVTYKDMKLGYPLSFDTCVMIYNRTYLEQWASQMALADLTGNPIDMGGGDSASEEVAGTETDTAAEDVDPEELEALTSEYIQKMVPYTLEDLMTIANSYSVPENVEGIMSWDVSSIMYNYWLVGGAMVVGGPAGDDVYNVSVNNEAAIECLTKYQNLHDYFSIESDDITYESVVQDFIDGKTVFTIGTYDMVGRLKEAAADGSFAYEYGFSEMPNATSEIPSSSLAVTSVACVNGYSSQKELAEKFALYLAKNEDGKFTELTGLASASRTFGWEGGADQIYALEYAGSVSMPKMMETENFWMQLETMFARIWEGGDVKEELDALEKYLNTVLSPTL